METIYTCLIVDDEKPAHEVIKSHISKFNHLQFVKSVYNGKEAMDVLQTEKIDIVFLDIDMPIVTGMELLQHLHPKPAIIMVTAYTDYAFEAFQQDTVDYLQKPISLLRFQKAMEKAIIFCEQKRKKEESLSHIIFKIDGENLSIPLVDIIYLNSMGNYVKIKTSKTNKALIVYDTLANLYSVLQKNNFVQTHRSFVVNKKWIETIHTDSITLVTKESIPLGRKFSVLVQ
jgi:two-component system, LytTR family, response regulator